LLKQALQAKEQQFGIDHSSIAANLNNLALLLQEQEKYEDAEKLFKHALSIYERVLGLEDSQTQAVQENS